MTTQFRVGDVVRTPGNLEERRIDVMGEASAMLCDGGVFVFHNLTLLRRPVQVGDRLKDAVGTRWWADGVTLQALRSHGPRGWTHEDGTPIEPPPKVDATGNVRCGREQGDDQAREAPPRRDAATFEGCKVTESTVEIGYVGSECGRFRIKPTPPLTEAEEIAKWGPSRNSVAERANRLSDECGALRSENDALLIENAKLRREIERLGRKR